MERLTERDEFGNADIIGVNSCEFQLRLRFDEFNLVTDALNRLAAYEDTGLEPQEIPTGLEMAQIAMILQAYRASGLTPDDLPRAAELVKADREGRLTVQSPPAKEGEPKPQCFYNDNYGLWCLGMSHEGDDEPTDHCKQCWYCESGNYADLRDEAEAALGGGVDG